MAKIYVTRMIPEAGINKLKETGHEVVVSSVDKVLSKDELVTALSGNGYDAVLCLLTDKIDADVLDAAGPQCKVFANYAVGFDNIDLMAAKKINMPITNTPGVLTDTVAEHTFALMLAIAHRIPEADRFSRAGKYHGWEPMLLLGNDISHKTVGVIGLGRIGSRVAHHAVRGFDANIIYHDIKPNADFEKEYGAVFKEKLEDLLKEADFISVHVPLLPSTKHLMNAEKFKLMKPTAYLVNTSRGPVIDEKALAEALQNKTIRGAALDVFENEPAIEPGLLKMENVILTPHIASGTVETRSKMAELAADNIIAVLSGETPPNLVK